MNPIEDCITFFICDLFPERHDRREKWSFDCYLQLSDIIILLTQILLTSKILSKYSPNTTLSPVPSASINDIFLSCDMPNVLLIHLFWLCFCSCVDISPSLLIFFTPILPFLPRFFFHFFLIPLFLISPKLNLNRLIFPPGRGALPIIH